MAKSIRILLVDDFESWRQQVSSMLKSGPELRIIAEAGDGMEAVQKAGELKPDLILMDIGLPKLDGVRAASRIRQVAPDAAIIFLTQNSDKDTVRAALQTGARGYVLKTDAGKELLTAVTGSFDRDVFVSSGIEDGSGKAEKHVAIVDDDEPFQNALQDLIESDGFSALCFGSAEQFLDSEARNNISCLITDIRMPGMSGLDLQAKLKAEQSRIPIIFITAHGDDEVRTVAMREGAVEFLTKPCDDEVLLQGVHAAVERRRDD